MRSFKILSLLIAVAVCFSGCMSSTHLKDLMVVEGIGIDKDSDSINICVQTLKADNLSAGRAPSQNMTFNTDETGKTIFDAISNLSNNLSKKVFFGHNKLIVFSSEICKSDLKTHLDYLLRSTESRVDVALCIAKDKAKDVIESNENESHVPSENIATLLKNGQDAGTSAYVTVNEVLNLHSDKTSDYYLPVVEKSENRDNVTTTGLGLFCDGALVYITDGDETMGLLMIRDKIDTCSLELKDERLGKIGVELYNQNVKNSTYIKNGNVVFKTQLTCEVMINEIEKGLVSELNADVIDTICKEVEEKISSLCQKAFKACQYNDSDCVRVGEYLAKDCPSSYDTLSDEWNMYFKTVEYEPHISVSLKEISNNTEVN